MLKLFLTLTQTFILHSECKFWLHDFTSNSTSRKNLLILVMGDDDRKLVIILLNLSKIFWPSGKSMFHHVVYHS